MCRDANARQRAPEIVSLAETDIPLTRSASEKSVIMTADDFGVSREVNAEIIRAHREGVLTGASLMVAGSARDEAAALARDNQALDVGLHLVLCRGTSVMSPESLGGIVDANRRFPDNPVAAGMRYFFDSRIRERLRSEIRAQIELHLKLIGVLNHIDGHLNFHVHPVIAGILIELAVEYRVKCIRLPREPILTTLKLARDHLPRKLVEAGIFRALSRRARRLMNVRGIRTTDWLFGLHQSGHLTEEYLIGVVARLRPGITEIYFHPAADAGGTPPPAEAQLEAAILRSASIREALQTAGARLTNFAELAHTSEAIFTLPAK
jgi:hopanoid biosynthesis associated protein HpnK